jgi:hypothetical protein
MKHRFLWSSVTVVTAIAAIAFLTAPMVAQTPKPAAPAANSTAKPWTPPRTAWGDPDLQGVYTSDDYINVGLQRAANMGTRLYLTDEEIAARDKQVQTAANNALQEFANPNGNVGTGPPGHWGERARRAPRQTSLVVEPEDGQMPALTADGRQRQFVANQMRQGAGTARPAESWENYSYYIRCITRGLAGSVLPVIYGNGTEIVQGPGYVAILQEMVHEARIIPLDGRPHLGNGIRSYMGDSRGRFEGNTLVIETTNFLENRTGIGLNGGGAPTSDALRVTERLTRLDKDTVNYEMRVEDPKTFTAPFKIAFPIRQEPGYQNFEYACHEGNHGMMNQLSGSRADERAAEEAARQQR